MRRAVLAIAAIAAVIVLEKASLTVSRAIDERRNIRLLHEARCHVTTEPRAFGAYHALLSASSGVSGAPPLADRHVLSLHRSAELHSFIAHDSRITARGLRALLSAPKLQSLLLESEALGDADVEALPFPTRLTVLGLNSPRLSDEALSKVVSKLPNLQQLDLSGTRAGGSTLEAISSVPNIEWILLDGSAVSNDDLRRLRPSETLFVLSLERTRVEGPFPLDFRHFPKLKALRLADSRISREEVERLRTADPEMRISWNRN